MLEYCAEKGIVFEAYAAMRGCPFSDPSAQKIAAGHMPNRFFLAADDAYRETPGVAVQIVRVQVGLLGSNWEKGRRTSRRGGPIAVYASFIRNIHSRWKQCPLREEVHNRSAAD